MKIDEWKSLNEKQLMQDFIEDYEDMFNDYCKDMWDEKEKE